MYIVCSVHDNKNSTCLYKCKLSYITKCIVDMFDFCHLKKIIKFLVAQNCIQKTDIILFDLRKLSRF